MLDFTISDHTEKGVVRRINVINNGEKITFKNDVSRSPLTNPAEVLQPLNDFVGHFSNEQCDVIFDIYKELYEISESTNGCLSPEDWLDVRVRVERLYRAINPESVFAWGADYGRFHNPPPAEMNNYAEETTYTPKEYRGLLSLTVLFKFMMPIWGEFYNHIKASSSKEMVELQCYNLLERTGIFELEVFKRLEKFVRYNKSIAPILVDRTEALPMSMVMANYGEHDLLPFILSRIVVKNMTFSETTLKIVKGKDNNLIGVIHHVILRRLDDLRKGFGGRLDDIRHPSESRNGGEEGNTSISENFTAKTEVSDVEPRVYNIFCQDIDRLVSSLWVDDTPLDKNIVKDCVDFVYYLSEHNNFYYDNGRQFIVATMLFGIIPEQGIAYLNRSSVLNVVGVSCAIFHTLGMKNRTKDTKSLGVYDMVKYMLASPVGMPDVEISGRALQAKNSMVPDNLIAALGEFYTHHEEERDGVKDILDWISDFVKYDVCSEFWIEQSPPELNKRYPEVYHNKAEWYADKEFKSFICLLLIYVFGRKLKTK